jgi:hypothetical protein
VKPDSADATCRGVIRCVVLMGLAAFYGCDVQHADHVVNVKAQFRIYAPEQQPIRGAHVRLTEDGRPRPEWSPLCVSHRDGMCNGRGHYAFGRTHYRPWGRKSFIRPTLALTVEAPGFESQSIPLRELTREELAGFAVIERSIVLTPR